MSYSLHEVINCLYKKLLHTLFHTPHHIMRSGQGVLCIQEASCVAGFRGSYDAMCSEEPRKSLCFELSYALYIILLQPYYYFER